jgi:hypothetical protein
MCTGECRMLPCSAAFRVALVDRYCGRSERA